MQKAIADATSQVNRYAEAQNAVELTRGTTLHKLYIVFHGLGEMHIGEV